MRYFNGCAGKKLVKTSNGLNWPYQGDSLNICVGGLFWRKKLSNMCGVLFCMLPIVPLLLLFWKCAPNLDTGCLVCNSFSIEQLCCPYQSLQSNNTAVPIRPLQPLEPLDSSKPGIKYPSARPMQFRLHLRTGFPTFTHSNYWKIIKFPFKRNGLPCFEIANTFR